MTTEPLEPGLETSEPPLEMTDLPCPVCTTVVTMWPGKTLPAHYPPDQEALRERNDRNPLHFVPARTCDVSHYWWADALDIAADRLSRSGPGRYVRPHP
jgi:hypothetical protein